VPRAADAQATRPYEQQLAASVPLAADHEFAHGAGGRFRFPETMLLAGRPRSAHQGQRRGRIESAPDVQAATAVGFSHVLPLTAVDNDVGICGSASDEDEPEEGALMAGDDDGALQEGELSPDGGVSGTPIPRESDAAAIVAGERRPWRELTREEKKARRQEWRELGSEGQKQRWDDIKAEAGRTRLLTKGEVFAGLGVRVRGGEVFPYPTFSQAALGPVEGARAELTDPTKAQMIGAGLASGVAFGTLLGPVALAPALLRKSKAVAFVVCANARFYEKKLDGSMAIRLAQSDAVKFNALVASVSPPASAEPPSKALSPRERLTELTNLHEDGLLTDEEYQAKHAEIISQL
jgi:hypothetical protein